MRFVFIAMLALCGCRSIAGLDDYGFDECSDPVCGLVSQCGCGDGEGCFYVAGANECAPAGEKTEGDACTTDAECEPGTSCLEIYEGSFCLRYCETHDDCQGSQRGGSRCSIGIGDGMNHWCSLDCDPVTAEGCPSGFGCHVLVSDVDGSFTTHCAGMGRKSEGDTCGSFEALECGPRLECVGGAGATCRRYCRMSGDDCDAGQTCARTFTSPGGTTDYGLCEDE